MTIAPELKPNSEITQSHQTTFTPSKIFSNSEAHIAENLALSVLLVEDVLIAQMAAVNILGDFHCKVDKAETGNIALEKAKKNRYDFILMDIGLPDESGITVAEKIHQFEKEQNLSRTPIFALTAHIDDSDKKEPNYDFEASFNKPLTSEKLESIIRQSR